MRVVLRCMFEKYEVTIWTGPVVDVCEPCNEHSSFIRARDILYSVSIAFSEGGFLCKTKLRGIGQRANYADRATAAC
jgi:hypothetical protein